jgi:Flp pilus assembly protein TadB
VQVKNHADLSQKTNKATQIVASLGGYAQSVQFQSERKGGNAFLDLRVPVGKTEAAIAKLEMLGKLVSQQLSTQDLQQQFSRQTNGIGSLRRAIAVYQEALKSGTLSATERVEIQIKLSNAQHSLRQLRKARSQTVASGATANISLTLTTHNSGVVGGGHHKSGRFDRLLGSAGDFLALEGIIVLYALIVVGPLLLIGGLAWWVVRERRRREESRLLASA